MKAAHHEEFSAERQPRMQLPTIHHCKHKLKIFRKLQSAGSCNPPVKMCPVPILFHVSWNCGRQMSTTASCSSEILDRPHFMITAAGTAAVKVTQLIFNAIPTNVIIRVNHGNCHFPRGRRVGAPTFSSLCRKSVTTPNWKRCKSWQRKSEPFSTHYVFGSFEPSFP